MCLLGVTCLSYAATLQVQNTAHYLGDGVYKWKLYLKGDEDRLNTIDHVEYVLDPSYSVPLRKVGQEGRSANFAISDKATQEFEVNVSIYYRTGEIERISHHVVLYTPDRPSFYVYQESGSGANHFSPGGWMGDVGDITIKDDWEENPKSGKTCIKIEYSAKGNKPTCDYAGPCKWAGVYWQEPPENWGKKQEWKSAGYDLSAYHKLKFWARAEYPSVIEFKVGGISGPYGDSLRPPRSYTAHVTREWKEFTLDLTGADLRHVIGGFAWFASKETNPSGTTFYLDDIRFEP